MYKFVNDVGLIYVKESVFNETLEVLNSYWALFPFNSIFIFSHFGAKLHINYNIK